MSFIRVPSRFVKNKSMLQSRVEQSLCSGSNFVYCIDETVDSYRKCQWFKEGSQC